jgi:hypothetical protein
MPSCLYCRRQIPGFEVICKECFEGRSYQLAHPEPWWQFRWFFAPRWSLCRPRLTRNSVYVFLLVFVYGILDLRFGYQPLAMKNCILFALPYALASAFLASVSKEKSSDFK